MLLFGGARLDKQPRAVAKPAAFGKIADKKLHARALAKGRYADGKIKAFAVIMPVEAVAKPIGEGVGVKLGCFSELKAEHHVSCGALVQIGGARREIAARFVRRNKSRRALGADALPAGKAPPAADAPPCEKRCGRPPCPIENILRQKIAAFRKTYALIIAHFRAKAHTPQKIKPLSGNFIPY